ncbi:MAG TPA: tetratricopeptide repeat protein [Terracidiphilus sp.]|nr:tetratricopeptide repeat protein [Terracidiphilus sp.]HEX4283599.1 tetratricopeptide repeat protein [Terracidiphilus sp.]
MNRLAPLRQRTRIALQLLGLVALCLPALAQAPTGDTLQDAQNAGKGRILLVLPFDNRSNQPNLEWIREAATSILSSRFTSAGFSPMSRADRMYALDHLGLPEGFQPSRASALKLAQTLDADLIVVGSFSTDGTKLAAEARVVDVSHLRMSAPVSASGEMRDLIPIFDSLAWRLMRQIDPRFNVAEETFVAAGRGLRLDAFEQYIRGITEPDHDERLRHLKQAVSLSSDFGAAWMALGHEDFAGQQYEEAAAAFAKVGRNEPDALEAGFYRGLSLLFSGKYPQAEAAFHDVATVLPLAEVLNNEGVAISREGKDGSAQFSAAETTDPSQADYHFNLAVSMKRHGLTSAALEELAQCIKLRPNDSEALELSRDWREPNESTTHGGVDQDAENTSRPDPLERIARTFDAVAFRQAVAMMDQIELARLAELAPHERAMRAAAQAKDYLDRGLLLEAERQYQLALSTDGSVAEAHAGLADVRERSGNPASARKEAQTSLELKPSVEAYLVLGRLDLAANHLDEAGREAGQALQLDPASREAQDLSHQIATKSGKSQ